MNPATLGRRAGALLIDSAIALLLMMGALAIFAGISFATGGAFPLPIAVIAAYLVLLAWFAFYSFLQAGAGSFGMRALGLRLARVDGTESPLGFGRALARNVVWGLGGAIVVGYFSPLFDSSPWRRGWHDKATGAVVTDIAGRGAPLPVAPPAGAAQPVPMRAGVTDAPGAPAYPVAPPPAPPAYPVASPTAPPAGPPVAPPVAPPPYVPTPSAMTYAGDTELVGRDAVAAPTPAPAPVLAPAVPVAPLRGASTAAGVISFVPGVTDPAARPVAAPAAMPSTPAPAAPAAPPRSRAGSAFPPLDAPPSADVDETRLSGPARQPLARIVWDDGTRHGVYGRSVFGRNPSAEPDATRVPVRDETLSLSKTHFELVVDEERALWVIDRESTNGVVIRRGTQRQTAVPGERTRVRMGDVLEIGDRSATVEVAS